MVTAGLDVAFYLEKIVFPSDMKEEVFHKLLKICDEYNGKSQEKTMSLQNIKDYFDKADSFPTYESTILYVRNPDRKIVYSHPKLEYWVEMAKELKRRARDEEE